jgi:predicted nuclease with TOPRIM domain
MPTATLERLPNTVTRCHDEIRRLQAALAGASIAENDPEKIANLTRERDSLQATVSELGATIDHKVASIADLEGERDELKETLTQSQAEVETLEARIEELEGRIEERADPVEAIDAFLDECERTGPLRFDVPQSDRANRAIVRLHDAVGRQP